MLETIVKIFSALSTAARTAQVLVQILRGQRGDKRALLEEIKENLALCWMLLEHGTAPMKIVKNLTSKEYDRILKTDFNFNSLKSRRIRGSKALRDSDLSSFIGKRTSDLIENVYHKIKQLKLYYRVDRYNPKINLRRRIYNLHKRMLLLIQHLRS